MQRAGLEVRLVRHFNTLLLPAQALQRYLLKRRAHWAGQGREP